MRLHKSTRYALYAALELASAGDTPVTAACVADTYGIPGSVIAKVFQQLVRAGIATGTRGPTGGYRLAKDPRHTTMLDVVDAFESSRPAGSCLLAENDADCGMLGACEIQHVFDEVDELVRCTFASISFATLVARRVGGGK